MPAMLFSSILCVLMSFLPNFPFWTRSRFPLLSAHANSYAIAREKAVTRRRIALSRAKEAREKERQLNSLRANVQAHEESKRQSSFLALQDRILLWNQIWKLEKELKALRTSSGNNGRRRQVVAEGGISSSSRPSPSHSTIGSASSASTSRVITGRSLDGSRVSWRAMLSLAMNASETTSNVDLNESVDEIVDEIAQILQARGACIGEGKRRRLASILEESYASSSPGSTPPASPSKSSTASSDSDSEEGTAVDSPTLVHVKLPPPTILCHDDHSQIFSPTHTSPDHADSMYDWIVDQSQREKEDWGKDVVFEPAPGVPRFSSWNDLLGVHSI